MSFIDDTFGPLAPKLVNKFGHKITFIKKENSAYDPNTGQVTEIETRYEVTATVHRLGIDEFNGVWQKNDVKIILYPEQIDYHYITEQDYFLVPRDTAPDEYMKVVEPLTYRGEKVVVYIVIARPR